jgi:hypothetical protein
MKESTAKRIGVFAGQFAIGCLVFLVISAQLLKDFKRGIKNYGRY